MSNLLAVYNGIVREIELSEQCLTNILARLDEDIARINERKVQLIEEFSARRCTLEKLVGVEQPEPLAPVVENVTPALEGSKSDE
jgi:acetone carboxylase gamma subunit